MPATEQAIRRWSGDLRFTFCRGRFTSESILALCAWYGDKKLNNYGRIGGKLGPNVYNHRQRICLQLHISAKCETQSQYNEEGFLQPPAKAFIWVIFDASRPSYFVRRL
ncbi:hypothetical protein OPR82_12375 [Brucella sp. YY2X]|uniref:Transposase n=1 Tax=Ochrobactrum chromiisoli TaxID=2993941 RepID=A0ABT3QPM1_9HYPH|nr:hypothetical protein [Ochrobactrum chromiisoli]